MKAKYIVAIQILKKVEFQKEIVYEKKNPSQILLSSVKDIKIKN